MISFHYNSCLEYLLVINPMIYYVIVWISKVVNRSIPFGFITVWLCVIHICRKGYMITCQPCRRVQWISCQRVQHRTTWPHLTHMCIYGVKGQTSQKQSPLKSPSFRRRAMGHSQDSKMLEHQAAIPEMFGSTPMIQLDERSKSSDSPLDTSPGGRRRLALKSIHISWPTSNSMEGPGYNSKR